MKIPNLDIVRLHKPIKNELLAAIEKVIDSGEFINGREVNEFERKLAEYCGVKYAVGVSSGTDALIAALMAFEVRPGDEIITTPYTFFATAGSIARLGAMPLFVDIEPDTFNINPNEIEEKITNKTVGIIPVHLFGQSADMRPILAVAKKHNLWTLEDAAQSIGAKYEGKQVGTFGDSAILSFFPAKNLGSLGDGGAVLTDNGDLAEKLYILRNHGSKPKYYHKVIGGNFRLDTIQAAVLLAKLPYLDKWAEMRRAVAAKYISAFKKCERVVVPLEKPFAHHVYNQFVIRVPEAKREETIKALSAEGIGYAIYYPLSLHEQECFAYLGYKQGEFPQSEKAAKTSLALPIDPNLSDDEIARIADVIINTVSH
ncbi:MAG: DegT/DnrJ/EryC1/StrS family aminotransferase [Myxococcota bacterium]